MIGVGSRLTSIGMQHGMQISSVGLAGIYVIEFFHSRGISDLSMQICDKD